MPLLLAFLFLTLALTTLAGLLGWPGGGVLPWIAVAVELLGFVVTLTLWWTDRCEERVFTHPPPEVEGVMQRLEMDRKYSPRRAAADLVRRGRRFEAVVVYRNITGLSVREARDEVDAIAREIARDGEERGGGRPRHRR